MKRITAVALLIAVSLAAFTGCIKANYNPVRAYEQLTDEKEYFPVSIEENFADDIVEVVLTKKASVEHAFHPFSYEDFGLDPNEVEIEYIMITEDLEYVADYWTAMDISEEAAARVTAEYQENGGTLNIDTFRQGLVVHLKTPSKERVIELVHQLEQLSIVCVKNWIRL